MKLIFDHKRLKEVSFAALVLVVTVFGMFFIKGNITGGSVLTFDNVTVGSINNSLTLKSSDVIYLDLDNLSYTLASFDVLGNGSNVVIDILDDGSIEFEGVLQGYVSMLDFSEDVNVFLSNCGSYPCNLPISIETDKEVVVKDLRIEYEYTDNNIVYQSEKDSDKDQSFLQSDLKDSNNYFGVMGLSFNSVYLSNDLIGFGMVQNFEVNVSDADNLILNIMSQNINDNYSMIDVGNDIWKYNLTVPYVGGLYNYTIFAKNVSDQIMYSGNFSVFVNATIQVRTLKDVYLFEEIVNLTDPPEVGS